MLQWLILIVILVAAAAVILYKCVQLLAGHNLWFTSRSPRRSPHTPLSGHSQEHGCPSHSRPPKCAGCPISSACDRIEKER